MMLLYFLRASKYISFIGKFFESFELQHLHVTIENLANNFECFDLKFNIFEVCTVIEILPKFKAKFFSNFLKLKIYLR